MTVWYSDHFGADGDNDTSLPALAKITDPGLSRGRERRIVARFTGLPLVATPDVIRMMRLPSNCRLYELLLCCDGGSAAGAVDIGLHEAGSNHDGAVVDADLFASAQVISSALDLTDVFDEATTLAQVDRGKRLWELAAKGAATYTSDPQLDFEVTLTVTTSFTTADSEIVLHAKVNFGD